MFNPSQLLKKSHNPSEPPPLRPMSRLVLDKMADHSRSRWDEPITPPSVLYQKLRVPQPDTSSSTKKQPSRYPPSLIDFIKRSYQKCKEPNQNKQMETELKALIGRYDADYMAVQWEKMPIPLFAEPKRTNQTIHSLGRETIREQLSTKKQPVSLHKQRSERPAAVAVQDQQTTKAKIKISKTLQKLEQKFNKKDDQPEPPSKPYIGFRNQPERNQISRTSLIRPGLRTVINPPPPPPLPIESQFDKKKSSKSSTLQQKFTKSSKPIEVVTSTVPEPMEVEKSYRYKREEGGSRGQEKVRGKGKVVITRKQLGQISKVAEKVSDLHQVAKRYESFNRLKQETIKNIEEDDDFDGDDIIIGRNTSIDKPYLRITGRPDADSVRPLPVLKRALGHFIGEFKKGSIPYDMLLSQLKSIRQDLTVQHIRNEFTVEVYEQNFKLSLFQSDVIQVKNCMANLWQLYREGLYRSKELRSKFISYNLVSLIMEQKYKQLEYMLIMIPDGSIDNSDIQNSLKLKQIYMLGNYRAFFDFYNLRDHVCRQLLNIYIDKMRMRCLLMFSKTCGEKISFSQLGETIGQDEDVIEALALGEGAVVRQGYLMLKQSNEYFKKSEFLVNKKITNLLI